MSSTGRNTKMGYYEGDCLLNGTPVIFRVKPWNVSDTHELGRKLEPGDRVRFISNNDVCTGEYLKAGLHGSLMFKLIDTNAPLIKIFTSDKNTLVSTDGKMTSRSPYIRLSVEIVNSNDRHRPGYYEQYCEAHPDWAKKWGLSHGVIIKPENVSATPVEPEVIHPKDTFADTLLKINIW